MTLPSEYAVGRAPDDVRQRLIVISGCSSGGKSSLLEALARLGHAVVPEPGRQVVREQLQVGGTALPWRDGRLFGLLCISRGMHSYNMHRHARAPVFFDRSMLDNICGLQGADGPLPDDLRAAVAEYRHADTVFFAPPWEALFENDAERRHTFVDAVAEYARLRAFYVGAGYRLVDLPLASVEARVAFVMSHPGVALALGAREPG